MSSTLKLLRIVAAAAALAALTLASPAIAQDGDGDAEAQPLPMPMPLPLPSADIKPQDFFPPVGLPSDEADADMGDQGSGKPTGYGQSRRLDAHDRLEDDMLRRRRAGKPEAATGSNGGKLICVAGCGARSETPATPRDRKPVASLTP